MAPTEGNVKHFRLTGSEWFDPHRSEIVAAKYDPLEDGWMIQRPCMTYGYYVYESHHEQYGLWGGEPTDEPTRISDQDPTEPDFRFGQTPAWLKDLRDRVIALENKETTTHD